MSSGLPLQCDKRRLHQRAGEAVVTLPSGFCSYYLAAYFKTLIS